MFQSSSEFKIKTNCCKLMFSLKISYCHEEYSFENPARKFLTQSTKIFAQCPKHMENLIFSIETLILKKFHLISRLQFWKACQRNVWDERNLFLLKVLNWKNKTVKHFREKLFFLRMLLWTHRKQSWNLRRKSFEIKPKQSSSRS